MNARLFQAAKDIQQLARDRRHMANDYDDKWKARCMAEATRAYLDGLLWLRLARPMNLGQNNE